MVFKGFHHAFLFKLKNKMESEQTKENVKIQTIPIKIEQIK